MRDFAFGPAALAGFDLLRRRPLATLGLALVGTIVILTARAMGVVSTHVAVGSPQRPELVGLFGLAATLTTLLALVLVTAIIVGAVARGGGPRLGGDEARLFILALVVVLPALAVLLLAVAAGVLMGMGLRAPGTADTATAVSAALGGLLILGPVSRLWLAGPMSIQAGGFRLMASWRLTRGRSWMVFGVFLTTLLAAGGLAILGPQALRDLSTALKFDSSTPYDPSLLAALAQAVTPAGIVMSLAQGLLIGLAVIAHAASAVFIHRRLVGDPAADQAAVFE